VLGGVGAVVGFIYGGPAGARWGFAIGSTIGSIVDPGTIKGPSIGDIGQQTSQEGGPRPIIFVRSPPIAGNVIAQSEPRIVKSKQGGKGGPKVVTESVFRTYAVGVCEGPISGFRRIWRNNVLVYDGTDDPGLPADDSAAFLEKARLFLGTYDQDASPDLEAIFGAGTTPAHRGTAYLVMADEDLTDLRGAIPQWTFEVSSGVTTVYSTDVLDPWTSSTTDPRYAPGDALGGYTYAYNLGTGGADGSTWSTLAAALSDGNAASNTVQPAGAYVNQIGYSFPEAALINADLKMSPVYSRDPGELVQIRLNYNRYSPANYEGDVVQANSTVACGAFEAFSPPITGAGSARYWWSGVQLDGLGGYTLAGTPYTSGVWRCASYTTMGPGEHNTNNCSGFSGSPQSIISPDVYIKVNRQPHKPEGDWTATAGSFKCLAIYHESSGVVTQYPLNPTMPVGDVHDTSAYWTAAYNAAVLAGTMPSGKVYGVDYPVAISTAWVGSGASVDTTAPLSTIISLICDRAGVPASSIDVTQIQQSSNVEEGIVYGLAVTNQYAAVEAIRAMGQIYLFDLSPRDGKLVFVPRGGDHVAVITEDDMVDDDQETSDDKRDDSISVPRVLHLNYHDVAGGLNTDAQTSERSGDRRSIGEASLQTPLILTADLAARAVVINHKVLVENAKGTLHFSVADNFIGLAVGDPVIVQKEGTSKRARIEKLDIFDGYQTLELSYDRQSAYTSDVEGIPAAPQTPPPTSIVGPTLIIPLDIPILKDVDDVVGLSYYVAVAGTSLAWQGALIELSYDGGANYIDSQIATNSATIGELSGTLGDHPQEFPDVVNQLPVTILTPDVDLEASTLAGMLSRANLAAVGSVGAGWELINFANVAEQSSEGEWLLDYFLRGRKDTNPTQHVAGESFVLLERGILGFIPASVTDIGRTLTFRATSLGAPTSTGTIVSMTYSGQSQTERHVGYLVIHPFTDSNGASVRITWQGVGRLGGGGSALQGAKFEGYRVTFDDHVNDPIVIDTLLNEVTQNISTLSAGIPVPDALLWTNLFSIHRVVQISGDYYGAKFTTDSDTISSIQRFSGTSNTRTGGMSIMNPGRITGFVYDATRIFVSVINTAGGSSKIYRINPADVTIGAVLAFSHEATGAPGDFQGIASDGTYLYASMAYTDAVKKFSLSVLGTIGTLSLPGDHPGAVAINGTDLYVCARGVDKIVIIDLGSFTETSRFTCVEFPLDILVTDDLVFVQGTHELGVYQHDGTPVAVYSAETIHTGAPTINELGYDGARVFRSNGLGIDFYGGSSGELSFTFPLPNPGIVGGYADSRYFVQNIADLVNITGEVYSSDLIRPTVAVAQLNDLTGAGPAIEVTLS